MKTKTGIHGRRYEDFRKAGYGALESLRMARTCAEFAEFEDEDVRIVAYPEDESYFGVFGEPEGYTDGYGRRVSAETERDEMIDLLDRLGCWRVCCEVRESSMGGDDEKWTVVDSVGMCAGYEDPCNPIQNCYVPDLMRAGLNALATYSI